MWLYNASINQIAFDDDGGLGLFSEIGMPAMSAGTYYVKVDEYDNDEEILAYDIVMSATPIGVGGAGGGTGGSGTGGSGGGVITGPDLEATSFSATTPTTVNPGDTVGVSYERTNLGDTATGTFSDGFYLSTDTTITTGDTLLDSSAAPSLPAGDSAGPFTLTLTIPSGTTPGTYFVGYFTDYQDDVTESNETNNTAIFQIDVATPTVGPDLTPTTFSAVTSTTVISGNTITVSSARMNQGDTASGTYNDGYYLSTNDIISTYDTLLAEEARASLGVGATEGPFDSILTIPSGTTAGTYYLGYFVDHDDGVTESLESNNTMSFIITVVDPPTGPDLEATSFVATSSTTVESGGTITVDYERTNVGGTATGSFADGYYLSTNTTISTYDTELYAANRSPMQPGASAGPFGLTLTIPSGTTAGTYYVGYFTDHLDAVTEDVETNNTLYFQVTVIDPVTGPDLVATTLSAVTSTTVISGDTITVSYARENQGDTASGAFTHGFYLSTNDTITTYADTELYSLSGMPSMAAGDTAGPYDRTLTIPSGTTAGSYYIGYFVDSHEEVTESIESNNTLAIAITVVDPPTGPDLEATSFVATSPTTVESGGTITVDYARSNVGGTATGSFADGYYLSTNTTITTLDTELLAENRSPMQPGDSVGPFSRTLTIPSGTTAGTYYIGYFTDHLDDVTEDVESNNTLYFEVTVIDPITGPDLVATALSAVTSTTVVSGETIEVSYERENQGDTASGTFTHGFYLSTNDTITTYADTELYSNSGMPSMAAGDTAGPYNRTLTIPSGTTAGTYYVGYFVDSHQEVTESIEDNNTLAIQITVVDPPTGPDLEATSFVATSPTSVESGGTITIDYERSNLGGTATGSFADGYYLSTNTTITTFDTELLAENRSPMQPGTSVGPFSRTLTIPSGTTAGTYYLGYFTDHLDAVTEDVETNNTLYFEITVVDPVTGPDLVATSLSPNTSTTVASGETIQVSYSRENQGDTASGTFDHGFYLSTNDYISTSDTLLYGYTGLPSLDPGDSAGPFNRTLTIPSGTTAGTYYIGYFVDDGYDVTESNEGNNKLTFQITVIDPPTDPDLVATTLSPQTPTTITAGEDIIVEYARANQGGTASGSFTHGFYLSTNDIITTYADTQLYSNSGMPSMSPGATAGPFDRTLTIPSGTAAGTYYIGYFVDSHAEVTESVEDNNTISFEITVVAPSSGADLVGWEMHATTSTTVVAGGNITVDYTRLNLGDTTASAFYNGFYLSTNDYISTFDTQLDQNYTTSHAPGATANYQNTVTIPSGTAAGTYYLGFFADHTSVVTETIEVNNTIAIQIEVQ